MHPILHILENMMVKLTFRRSHSWEGEEREGHGEWKEEKLDMNLEADSTSRTFLRPARLCTSSSFSSNQGCPSLLSELCKPSLIRSTKSEDGKRLNQMLPLGKRGLLFVPLLGIKSPGPCIICVLSLVVCCLFFGVCVFL